MKVELKGGYQERFQHKLQSLQAHTSSELKVKKKAVEVGEGSSLTAVTQASEPAEKKTLTSRRVSTFNKQREMLLSVLNSKIEAEKELFDGNQITMKQLDALFKDLGAKLNG